MRRQFEERFEMELEKINQSLSHKAGVKRTDKVHQRIGRARRKYPSVQHYYDIEVKTSEDKLTATELLWSKNTQKYEQKENTLGIYFLKTSLSLVDEVMLWNIYNTIREIEFLQLSEDRSGFTSYLSQVRCRHDGTPAFRAAGLLVSQHCPF